jgi:hypothetical protein
MGAFMTVMQFYTDEACESGTADTSYERYLEEHWAEFPDSLRSLNAHMVPHLPAESPLYLHDARINSQFSEPETFTLVLRADNLNNPVIATLSYHGVISAPTVPESLLRDVANADLMIDETIIIDSGRFQHAMLFAEGIELCVQFRELEITQRPW